MYNIIKNLICLLVINIFTDVSFVVIYMLAFQMFKLMDDEITVLQAYCITILSIFLVMVRLFVLPIAYKKLENSKTFELVSKFIKNLKQSIRLKLLVLVIAYFCYCPFGFPYFDCGFDGQLIQGVLLGSFGSYLVLFLYWFIEDKIKKVKNQSADKA